MRVVRLTSPDDQPRRWDEMEFEPSRGWGLTAPEGAEIAMSGVTARYRKWTPEGDFAVSRCGPRAVGDADSRLAKFEFKG